MFLLSKTRATTFADLSSVNRTGFVSPADPINCVVEAGALAAEGAAEAGEAAGEEALAEVAQVAEAEFGQATERNVVDGNRGQMVNAIQVEAAAAAEALGQQVVEAGTTDHIGNA
jgi:hypothetical protein